MNNFLSVVIPAYKKDSLFFVLDGIKKQVLPKEFFEVIIVDDFSPMNIKKEVLKQKKLFDFGLKIFRNSKNEKPAYSRNRGIKESSGGIILFLGDDIIPNKNLFKIHLEKHKENPQENIAVLGYVTWSKKIKITPLMEWLENGGPQNAYPEIKDKKWVSCNYFYGANISLKKDFLLKNGLFNEGFKKYGFEDIELGYRLQKRGLKILYEKKARGFHRHKIFLDDVLKRMKDIGENAVFFNRLHPELKIINSYFIPRKKIAREIIFNPFIVFILRKIAAICENKRICPRLYTRLVSLYFFKGVKNGLKIYG